MRRIRGSGFTLIEMMVTVGIIGVLVSLAFFAFARQRPDSALKRAAMDLYVNMQLARITAIKQHQQCGITFDTVNNNYTISIINKTVNLSDYGFGITYSSPSGDTYSSTITQNPITFDSKGIANNAGSVAISNSSNTSYYRVITTTSGVIRLRKWNGASWE